VQLLKVVAEFSYLTSWWTRRKQCRRTYCSKKYDRRHYIRII